MSNQTRNSKKGLSIKDLVTIGIFTALLFVTMLVGGIVFAPNPVLTFYMPLGAALLGGPVMMLLIAKVPKPGVTLIEGSIIKLYSASTTTRTSVTVPDLKGLTYLQAKNSLASKNLNIKLVGTSGKVISQDITAATSVEEGTVVTVTLQEELSSTAR